MALKIREITGITTQVGSMTEPREPLQQPLSWELKSMAKHLVENSLKRVCFFVGPALPLNLSLSLSLFFFLSSSASLCIHCFLGCYSKVFLFWGGAFSASPWRSSLWVKAKYFLQFIPFPRANAIVPECTTTSQPQSLAIFWIGGSIARIFGRGKQIWPFFIVKCIATATVSLPRRNRNLFPRKNRCVQFDRVNKLQALIANHRRETVQLELYSGGHPFLMKNHSCTPLSMWIWVHQNHASPFASDLSLQTGYRKEFPAIHQKKPRVVSVKSLSAILGPEMGASILWAPGKMRSFCRKNPCP